MSVASSLRVSVLCVVLVSGCAQDPGELSPDAALTEFLAQVEASTHDPEQLKAAYDWLDKKSRAALKERAARTAALAGRKLEPWEMIVPGRRSFAGFGRPLGRMKVRVEGERATVEIPIERRAPAEVSMVREDGRWRVVLGLSGT